MWEQVWLHNKKVLLKKLKLLTVTPVLGLRATQMEFWMARKRRST